MDDFIRELVTLGRSYFQRKQYQRAERYLNQVAERCPSFADVFNMLGVIAHDKGQYDQARRNFEKALEINPGYTEAALNLAIIYNDTGMYREAREVYERALAAHRTSPGELDRFVKGKIANMYADIGDVYHSSAHYEAAIAEYQRALELGPSFPDIRARLATALRDKGDREGALKQLQQIVEQSPGYLPARIQLGAVLLGLGRPEEAVRQWEEVLRNAPDNKSAAMYLKLVREAQKAGGVSSLEKLPGEG